MKSRQSWLAVLCTALNLAVIEIAAQLLCEHISMIFGEASALFRYIFFELHKILPAIFMSFMLLSLASIHIYLNTITFFCYCYCFCFFLLLQNGTLDLCERMMLS